MLALNNMLALSSAEPMQCVLFLWAWQAHVRITTDHSTAELAAKQQVELSVICIGLARHCVTDFDDLSTNLEGHEHTEAQFNRQYVIVNALQWDGIVHVGCYDRQCPFADAHHPSPCVTVHTR